MNENTISKYFDEPNKVPPSDNQLSDFMKKLKNVENLVKSKEKYDKLFNNLKKAYTTCITNKSCHNFNQFAKILISLAFSGIYNYESEYFVTVFKDSLYYCSRSNICDAHALHKNDVLKDVTENKDREDLEKLYDSLCSFLESISTAKIIKYIIFFSSNSQTEFDVAKLLPFLPNVHILLNKPNLTFIFSSNWMVKYISFNNQAYTLYCDEIFKFDSEFFTKFLSIPINSKFKVDFNNMINIMSNEITKKCKKVSKPEPTIYYTIYNTLAAFPNHIYKLCFNNNCISLSECSNTLETDIIEPFRPISITDSNILSRVINGYKPDTLYKYLLSIAQDSSDFTQIGNISKALAMTMISFVSKRQMVVVSCNNDNMVQAQEIFFRLICTEEACNTSVVSNNYDIRKLNSKSFRNILNKISYTKTRALFVNNSENDVTDGTKEKLLQILSDTNVQIFVFQTSRNVDYIPADKLIHINLSDWETKENSSCMVREDLLWGRLYLPVYGLHLIFSERNNKNKFEIKYTLTKNESIFGEMDQNEIIKEISEKFINRCFVSAEEAKIRKEERRAYINKIKEENVNCSDEDIKNLLEQQPLFSTYNSDFLEYADVFLATQYPQNEIFKYKITSKTIKKYIKDNYNDTFSYTTLNILYTKYSGRAQGFAMLSLKNPWAEIEKQLKETNVNNTVGMDKIIELQLSNLIEALTNTIDFRHLSIYK